MIQHNSDGTDPGLPVMGSDDPWQWLEGLIVDAVHAIGIVAIVVICAGFAGYFWGKL